MQRKNGFNIYFLKFSEIIYQIGRWVTNQIVPKSDTPHIYLWIGENRRSLQCFYRKLLENSGEDSIEIDTSKYLQNNPMGWFLHGRFQRLLFDNNISNRYSLVYAKFHRITMIIKCITEDRVENWIFRRLASKLIQTHYERSRAGKRIFV